MVPKLHSKGSSFKGAAQYLLHDKDRAQSDERVAWTETRNLAVDDPDIAWRIMAATAMDQGRLKEQAGVKNTGRKSDKHVLHFTLAWHPDQSPTREDMSTAADEAIKALGGSDRQAMIIAHDDEKHAHVHIMLNRVSPIDGRHLSSSKEKLKLSEWAQDYEERTGIYCENRIINNAMRKDGEYVRGDKDSARHIFESQRDAAANDNDSTQAVAEQQRKKDAVLAQRSRNQADMQKRAWAKLTDAHRERKAALARDLQRKVNKAKNEIRDEHRPKWQDLNRHQRAEKETFDELEKSFFGRTSNIAKTMHLAKGDIGGERRNIIARSFQILTNAGARKEYFEKAQQAARKALQREQDMKAQQAAKFLKEAQERKYAQNRAVFLQERDNLMKTQEAERASLQADWQQRNAERQAKFGELANKPQADQSNPRRQFVSVDELMKLRALEQKRRSQHAGTGQDNKPPAPEGAHPKPYKVDFNKLRKDMRETREKQRDQGKTQSDDDMDI
jgi:hypothetical protein